MTTTNTNKDTNKDPRDWEISRVSLSTTSTRGGFTTTGTNHCARPVEGFIWTVEARYTIGNERYDFTGANFTPAATREMVRLGLTIDAAGTMRRIG